MLSTLEHPTQTQFITDANATFNNVRTLRYRVTARLFEDCQATEKTQEFDVLVRQEIWSNLQLSRILKNSLGRDWRVMNKELAQAVHAF